jgi:glycosyltransferase involved in cell wall biosynthesis
MSADTHYVNTCLGNNPPIRYSEWHINGAPSDYARACEADIRRWNAPELSGLCNDIYKQSAGAVTALYEYNEICRSIVPDEKLAYGGIPIDTTEIGYVGTNPSGRKVRIFLGRHAERTLEKGTDKLQVAAQRVVAAHGDICELDIVENLPYSEYLKHLQEADIVLDQLYSYTPATNALLAMAMGKTVVSGGEPEYYEFIGEYDNRPIINAVPDDDEALFRSIENAVMHPGVLTDMSSKNRDFVIKHNDVMVVAQRYLDFWKKSL